jgi:serine/threonine protein kinase
MFGYEEEKLIGSGSFGNVYRVRKGDEFFALKEMNDKEARDREVQFLKLAEHPLFPKYLDSFDEGKFYILEEYVWGTSLEDCILHRNGFAQPEAMRFALSIADGIAFLQQTDGNILFRDLKAENLIVQPDGEIRLCDLGAATFLDEAADSLAGTPGETAPEQLEKGAPQGMYSDVYAFGKLFYYMLTGIKPGKDAGELSIKAVDPSYSASLELLIRQCCAPDPEVRIPDMYNVLVRLMDIATSTPGEYGKLEKNAQKILKECENGSNVVFSRNVQS